MAKNYSELRKKYPGRFVVVLRRRVVADAPTVGKATAAARKAARKEHVPVDEALIEYVPMPGQAFAL